MPIMVEMASIFHLGGVVWGQGEGNVDGDGEGDTDGFNINQLSLKKVLNLWN